MGKFFWADGAHFIGEWAENKMNGKGVFTEFDGRVYDGAYAND